MSLVNAGCVIQEMAAALNPLFAASKIDAVISRSYLELKRRKNWAIWLQAASSAGWC